MSDSVVQASYEYLPIIIAAVEKFYQRDYELLRSERHTHEQTVSFRIAKYLSERLECDDSGKRVDCEYHGDVYSPTRRKMLDDTRIRPDIIFHDRYDSNEFCIEMKINSPSQHDFHKINGLISKYDYREGYCICNIGKRYVTIYATSNRHQSYEKFRLYFDACLRVLMNAPR